VLEELCDWYCDFPCFLVDGFAGTGTRAALHVALFALMPGCMIDFTRDTDSSCRRCILLSLTFVFFTAYLLFDFERLLTVRLKLPLTTSARDVTARGGSKSFRFVLMRKVLPVVDEDRERGDGLVRCPGNDRGK
jgi:hypothetical protein